MARDPAPYGDRSGPDVDCRVEQTHSPTWTAARRRVLLRLLFAALNTETCLNEIPKNQSFVEFVELDVNLNLRLLLLAQRARTTRPRIVHRFSLRHRCRFYPRVLRPCAIPASALPWSYLQRVPRSNLAIRLRVCPF